MSLREKKQPKRQRAATLPGNSFSRSLRAARELIYSGDQAAGLAALNSLATQTRNPRRRARILLTIGESQTTFSRHSEAAAAFSRAADLARQAADLDLLLLASTGQIRALLRSLHTEQALTVASELLDELDFAQHSLNETLGLTPEQLASQGPIEIPARPPRPTVGLTKLAHVFLESGHTDHTREFLLKAIQLSPNGASRARQVLARLALASDEPALAERYAREALLMGRFQGKTTAAWPLYLNARARQNLNPILEADVYAAFHTHAKGRIAAASFHQIVACLRAHADPSWKMYAEAAASYPHFEPVLRTEIEKVLLADAKLFSIDTPRPIAARALRLYRAADCSAKELISHAKTYVRHSLLADELPDLSRLIRIATRRFPDDSTLHFAIRHTAALGAMMAVKHDIARDWLNSLTADAAVAGDLEAWGKATWALARMEALLENDAQAAFWYLDLAANEQTPARFRIQAMLRGLRHLGKSGDHSTDIGQLTDNIRSILNSTDDFRILLDAARQLALAGPSFGILKNEAADRGTALADKAIANAQTTQEQLAHLEYLARKHHWDLARNADVIDRWKALTDIQKTAFHATEAAIWYDYLAVVFLSLADTGRHAEAEALASGIIDANRATPEGYVILGSTYAEWLLHQGQKEKAFEFFDWIAKESPTHRKAAIAHFCNCLYMLIKGDLNQARKHAAMAHVCIGSNPSFRDEYLMAKSIAHMFDSKNVKQLILCSNNTINFSIINDEESSHYIQKLSKLIK